MKQVKRCMALVLALLLALGAMGAMAASTSVKINSTNFPDSAFRKYVKAEFDTNKDGKLSAKEIKKVTEINVTEMGIASLKGIERFTALEQLYCNDNRIAKLDLRKNTKLFCLECMNNRLTSLKLGKLKDLGSLYCSGNPKLSSLDIGGCPLLKGMIVNELFWATKKYAAYGNAKEIPVITDVKLTLKNGKKVLRKYGKPKAVGFTKSAISVKKGEFTLEGKGVFIRMEPATAIYPFKITTKDTAILALFEDDEQFCEAKKKGVATVTVSCGGKKGKLKVTVK